MLGFPGDTRNFAGGALYTGLVAPQVATPDAVKDHR